MLFLKQNSYKMRPETQAIRLQTERSQYKEHSVPLYLTSSYAFDIFLD